MPRSTTAPPRAATTSPLRLAVRRLIRSSQPSHGFSTPASRSTRPSSGLAPAAADSDRSFCRAASDLVVVGLLLAPPADAPLLALPGRRLQPAALLLRRVVPGVGLLPPQPPLLHIGGEAAAELVEAMAVEVDLGDPGRCGRPAAPGRGSRGPRRRRRRRGTGRAAPGRRSRGCWSARRAAVRRSADSSTAARLTLTCWPPDSWATGRSCDRGRDPEIGQHLRAPARRGRRRRGPASRPGRRRRQPARPGPRPLQGRQRPVERLLRPARPVLRRR